MESSAPSEDSSTVTPPSALRRWILESAAGRPAAAQAPDVQAQAAQAAGNAQDRARAAARMAAAAGIGEDDEDDAPIAGVPAFLEDYSATIPASLTARASLTAPAGPQAEPHPKSLECPICLEVTDCAQHQCREGHTFCAGCDARLVFPRRCPACRMALGALDQAIRNRSHEERIAVLPAACAHCGLPTTRGELGRHELGCPQRPRSCAAAEAGCTWSGMVADKAAHEATCPLAVCQRMLAPLRARVVALEAELRSQGGENEQLLSRLAALEAGEAGEGAAPSDAAVQEMDLAAAMSALRAHASVPRVAAAVGERLADLCADERSRQAAAEAGAIELVMAALRTHSEERVQCKGCAALGTICSGTEGGAEGRQQRAADAGALEAVVAAMRAHPQSASVQWSGGSALANLCGDFEAGAPREQRAAGAGAFEAVVAGMRTHPQHAGVQEAGCEALANMCSGDDAVGAACEQRAVRSGAIEAAVAAMCAHLQEEGVQEWGCTALTEMCSGSDDAAAAREERAADAGALEAVVAAMRAHPTNAGVQEEGISALTMLCGDAVPSREARAAEAGAIEAVVAAMRAHPTHAGVQAEGCHMLYAVSASDDAPNDVARARAAEVGALEAMVAAMRAHAYDVEVQENGCWALANVVGQGRVADSESSDAVGRSRSSFLMACARAQRAAASSAIEAVVAALRAHPREAGVQENGCLALAKICISGDGAGRARKQRAVELGALEAATAALRAHPHKRDVQEQAQGLCYMLAVVPRQSGAGGPSRPVWQGVHLAGLHPNVGRVHPTLHASSPHAAPSTPAATAPDV